MKIVIKREDVKKHNPIATALHSTLYRKARINDTNKKVYDRKKVKIDV